MTIRPAEPRDFAAIVALNEESVKYTAPMDIALLTELDRQSALHLVAEEDGAVVGFVLTIREGQPYDSINYVWFCQHYETFLYVDRIVVGSQCRGRRVGEQLYERVFEYAREIGVPGVTAEINVEPPNLPSLAFHKTFGFAEVGRHMSADGQKLLSLEFAGLNKK